MSEDDEIRIVLSEDENKSRKIAPVVRRNFKVDIKKAKEAKKEKSYYMSQMKFPGKHHAD
jgi:hypothetical protein